MTFWQWLSENKVKLMGSITTMNATLIALVAGGAFNAVLSTPQIVWLGIFGALVGAALTGAGFSNTTKERVAAAMQTAINATPQETPNAKP